MNNLKVINQLSNRGALFIVNHSGGKDSQAMMLEISKLVHHDQILVVHAELPGVDWPGIPEHIRSTISHDIPFRICKATKTFFDMVRHRQMFPSPKYRQCTSDLKRGPIERTIRQYIQETGHTGLIVNCMGIRAQESSARAKATTFKYNKRNSKAGREWYDWLPIHEMQVDEVFGIIEKAEQSPHWAYAAGMSRLSCCFCIMSSKCDLQVAARINPDHYREIVELEKEVDHTLTMPRKGCDPEGLEEVTGIKVIPIIEVT